MNFIIDLTIRIIQYAMDHDKITNEQITILQDILEKTPFGKDSAETVVDNVFNAMIEKCLTEEIVPLDEFLRDLYHTFALKYAVFNKMSYSQFLGIFGDSATIIYNQYTKDNQEEEEEG